MESLRIVVDASVVNKTILGYIVYSRDGDTYEKIDKGMEEVNDEFDSHKAEELAIINGLSAASEYYSEGTVTILTDHQPIVERVRHRNKLSSDRGIKFRCILF